MVIHAPGAERVSVMAQPLATTVPNGSASRTFFAVPRVMAYSAAEPSCQSGAKNLPLFS